MARMKPRLTPTELQQVQSSAEAKFYRWCSEQLDDTFIVLHSREWVDFTTEGAREGETDFTICSAEGGLLVVEVKGGGIRIDSERTWYSVNRNSVANRIKNPFEQARRQRHEIEKALDHDGMWRKAGEGRCTVGYGVFFPDVIDVSSLVDEQERPRPLIGSANDAERIVQWIHDALLYWSGPRGIKKLGSDGLKAFEQLFCRTVEVRPALAEALLQEDLARIELTQQQTNVLRFLGTRTRAKIVGGAGTGKTMLAMDKARSLAQSGKEVLLLCYNRLLADKMAIALTGVEHLTVQTFHQFCIWATSEVKKSVGRDLESEQESSHPASDRYEVVLPNSLVDASSFLSKRFDAIIVDEGQDFKEAYWVGIELFLRERPSGILYVFYDDNQAIYSRLTGCPIFEDPFELTQNCRNTAFIHNAAYRYYSGQPQVFASKIQGEPVQFITSSDQRSQAERMLSKVIELLNREHIRSGQIQILVAGFPKTDYYSLLRELSPGVGLELRIEGEPRGSRNAIGVDTVGRFKGLEADVVFLWGPEQLVDRDLNEALYVGLSRACGRLFLVGTSRIKQFIGEKGVPSA